MEQHYEIALFYPDQIDGTELNRTFVVPEKDEEELNDLLRFIKSRGCKHYRKVRRLVTYSEWETLEEQ